MAGRRLLGVVAIVVLLGGCGQITAPTTSALPNAATAVTSRIDGRVTLFTVSPWPLDGTRFGDTFRAG